MIDVGVDDSNNNNDTIWYNSIFYECFLYWKFIIVCSKKYKLHIDSRMYFVVYVALLSSDFFDTTSVSGTSFVRSLPALGGCQQTKVKKPKLYISGWPLWVGYIWNCFFYFGYVVTTKPKLEVTTN